MLLRAALVLALAVIPLASAATQITNVCDAQFCLASSPAACGGQCFLTAASGDSSVRRSLSTDPLLASSSARSSDPGSSSDPAGLHPAAPAEGRQLASDERRTYSGAVASIPGTW